MRIAITGGNGQLGRALACALEAQEVISLGRDRADICDSAQIMTALRRAEPDLVIHCAAFTDVDGSARQPERAQQVNALGTRNVALACRALGADMAHISTNEVFGGDRPGGYEEWMALGPVNPYGRSKAAAEHAVRGLLSNYYIIRTAWLYSAGGRNFVHAILERARQGGPLRVVADEIGNPTYAPDLAAAINQLVQTGQYGVYHLTNSGVCSRWAFAAEILRQAGLNQVPNQPIRGRDYARASTPPAYGALVNLNAAALGISLRPWQAALADFMAEAGAAED
ncbi:MAG: dTDP-4-dehydrorhamnose reductase [Candidatus Promineifilaceae bacterium]